MRRSTLRRLRVGCFATFSTGVALFVFLLWLGFGVHTPDLTPTRAASLISARPEFNRYARIVEVSSTARGADSLKNSTYWAEFMFLQNGSATIIKAHAEFYYWQGAWRLDSFWYGEPPNVKMVDVGR